MYRERDRDTLIVSPTLVPTTSCAHCFAFSLFLYVLLSFLGHLNVVWPWDRKLAAVCQALSIRSVSFNDTISDVLFNVDDRSASIYIH